MTNIDHICRMLLIFIARAKQELNVVKGIASQFILAKNSLDQGPSPMTALNIMLKFNVKLAGTNWAISPSITYQPVLQNSGDVLFLGIDVEHKTRQLDVRYPSIACVRTLRLQLL